MRRRRQRQNDNDQYADYDGHDAGFEPVSCHHVTRHRPRWGHRRWRPWRWRRLNPGRTHRQWRSRGWRGDRPRWTHGRWWPWRWRRLNPGRTHRQWRSRRRGRQHSRGSVRRRRSRRWWRLYAGRGLRFGSLIRGHQRRLSTRHGRQWPPSGGKCHPAGVSATRGGIPCTFRATDDCSGSGPQSLWAASPRSRRCM